LFLSAGELSLYPPHPITNSEDDFVNLPSTHGKNCCILKQTKLECLRLVDCQGNKFSVDANGDYQIEKSDEFIEGRLGVLLVCIYICHMVNLSLSCITSDAYALGCAFEAFDCAF